MVESLSDEGLCEIEERQYIRCAYEDDPDYKYIDNRDCTGKIHVNQPDWVCTECGRNVTEHKSKKKFSEKELHTNQSGIRDYVRNNVKSEFDTNARTVDRSYASYSHQYVLKLNDPNVNIFLLFNYRDQEFVKWCRLYDENCVMCLVDEAIPLKKFAEDWNVPWFTMEDIYPVVSKSATEAIQNGPTDVLDHRYDKGKCANELAQSARRQMAYDDFEQCVQRLFVGAIGNSQLLGSKSAGKPVPDGTLTLSFENKHQLYMWDAKFAKYDEDDDEAQTELSGEYDKIFRHLSDLNNRDIIQNRFGDIQGIILVSPGIKNKDVENLASFISDQELLTEDNWGGIIVYFRFDALRRLFQGYLKGEAGVQSKEEIFRIALHSFFQNPEKHPDDPKVIEDSTHKTVCISEEDIERVFSKIEGAQQEEQRFPVEDHMNYLDITRSYN